MHSNPVADVLVALASLDKPLEFRRAGESTPTAPSKPVIAATAVDGIDHARRVRESWQELCAPDGTPYYHNTVTLVVTWTGRLSYPVQRRAASDERRCKTREDDRRTDRQ